MQMNWEVGGQLRWPTSEHKLYLHVIYARTGAQWELLCRNNLVRLLARPGYIIHTDEFRVYCGVILNVRCCLFIAVTLGIIISLISVPYYDSVFARMFQCGFFLIVLYI